MTTTGRITVRKSTMVRPAQETPRRRLWLSSLDLASPGKHTPSVRFYRGDGGGVPGFFDGERMRRALAEALVPFYPLAGRLGRDGEGRLEIDCNGEGALFVEADAADTAVDDFGDFTPTAELRRLVPDVGEYDTDDDDVSAFPLLLVQVTRFRCGGVCLGIGTDHYVSDGMSTVHFINAWAELCRGEQISSPPPFIDRTLLRARVDQPTFRRHDEYLPPPPALPATTAKLLLSAASDETAVEMFKLTRSDLARLRSRYCLPAGDDDEAAAAAPAPRRRLSMFAVVAAHVWRCVSLARGLPPEQPTMLLTAVDGRTRLNHPPLPDGFYGNVVFHAAPIAEAGTVMTRGASSLVQAALDRVDGEYCRSALDYLDRLPPEELAAIARRREAAFWYNLVVTSWVRMPIHGADFGWGRPVFMGPAGIAKEGVAVVFPCASGDGGLFVVICLQAEHMGKFRELMNDATAAECCSTARCSKM